MIETIVRNYLTKKLDVPVYLNRPEKLPQRYVYLDKTGSSKANQLPNATLALQSYAENRYEASVLNNKVKYAIEQIVFLPEIRGVELNSDYYFPDTQKKRYRYQAVYEIKYY